MGSLIDLLSMINIIKNVKKFFKFGKLYIYKKILGYFIEKFYNIKLILYFIKIKFVYCFSIKVYEKCINIDFFELGEKWFIVWW